MSKPIIMCVDDQRDVLAALKSDLESFAPTFELLTCESGGEAEDELRAAETQGRLIALILCDQVMPDLTGVAFLSELSRSGRFGATRKVLLTGLATQEDTISAINNGGIHYYLAKPWDKETLQQVVRQQLTHALIAAGLDYQLYLSFLDQETLYAILRREG